MTAYFKPMLAAKTPDDLEPFFKAAEYHVLASPKLDGVRATVQNGVVYSRSLKPIPNKYTQKTFGCRALEGCDGELIVGAPYAKDVFKRTTSAVMSVEGQPSVWFYVFDRFSAVEVFASRRLAIPDSYTDGVRSVSYTPVTLNTLFSYEADALAHGYEGVMLRGGYSWYKQGRSTVKEGGLVKVKRFQDAEAVVLGVEPLMHNDNVATVDALGHTKRSSRKANKVALDKLGALVCQGAGFEPFSIGTGFTDAERLALWAEPPIGKIVKYRYLSVGTDAAPRHPVFVGFRDEKDM